MSVLTAKKQKYRNLSSVRGNIIMIMMMMMMMMMIIIIIIIIIMIIISLRPRNTGLMSSGG